MSLLLPRSIYTTMNAWTNVQMALTQMPTSFVKNALMNVLPAQMLRLVSPVIPLPSTRTCFRAGAIQAAQQACAQVPSNASSAQRLNSR